jgi:hypothetical protein
VRVQEGTRKLQSIKHAQLELEPAKIPPTRSPHTAWALSHLLFQATSLPLFALTSIYSCLDSIFPYRCSYCSNRVIFHQVQNAQVMVINTPLIVLTATSRNLALIATTWLTSRLSAKHVQGPTTKTGQTFWKLQSRLAKRPGCLPQHCFTLSTFESCRHTRNFLETTTVY